jgi:hypothetical protein
MKFGKVGFWLAVLPWLVILGPKAFAMAGLLGFWGGSPIEFLVVITLLFTPLAAMVFSIIGLFKDVSKKYAIAAWVVIGLYFLLLFLFPGLYVETRELR